jgi:hypothetical protein
MGGGLMQLVAYGAQDIYLTGNPQITFFKVVYRRHTNFSMEAIEQTWNGTTTTDGRCTATISRNGDLVHRMYLEVVYVSMIDCNNPGSRAITNVELEIGGQRIDKHSGTWMEVWAELTQPNPTGVTGLQAANINPGTLFQRMSGMGGVTGAAVASRLFVPLQFWFCRNPGLALPLIALQYHEVKVILDHVIGTVEGGTATANKLWCDYIYLDTDERRRFAQVSHEYLIEQVQEQTITAGSVSNDLNFNHPVKELIWTMPPSTVDAAVTSSLQSIVDADTDDITYSLKLNGHDRFATRDFRYFTRTQVWQHHSGAGGLNSNISSGTAGLGGCYNDSIAVYSFALKPEEHQPSGTCNFSRIDNAQLVASAGSAGTSNATLVFAVNYNVLRIMSGMGGLAYSN